MPIARVCEIEASEVEVRTARVHANQSAEAGKEARAAARAATPFFRNRKGEHHTFKVVSNGSRRGM